MTRDLAYLKQVSRVKHEILKNYLAPWAKILGSANERLAYVDCFAGRGVYADENGQLLPGSPVIALRVAKELVQKGNVKSFVLHFVEKNPKVATQLRASLNDEGGIPGIVDYQVTEATAEDFVDNLISFIGRSGPGGRIIPAFFFIDPFGYPISVSKMRELLQLGKTELLVNVMSFRLCMHPHLVQMS